MLKTKDVFDNVKKYSFEESKHNNIIKALKNNDKELLDDNIYNDLLLPATCVNSELSGIISNLESTNSRVHMSGSGSTLFVVNFSENTINELEKDKKIEFIQQVSIVNAIS